MLNRRVEKPSETQSYDSLVWSHSSSQRTLSLYSHSLSQVFFRSQKSLSVLVKPKISLPNFLPIINFNITERVKPIFLPIDLIVPRLGIRGCHPFRWSLLEFFFNFDFFFLFVIGSPNKKIEICWPESFLFFYFFCSLLVFAYSYLNFVKFSSMAKGFFRSNY